MADTDKKISFKLIIKDYDDDTLLSNKKIKISSVDSEEKETKSSNSSGEVTFTIKDKDKAECFNVKLLDDVDYEEDHHNLGKNNNTSNTNNSNKEGEESATVKCHIPRDYQNHAATLYFKKKSKRLIPIGVLKAYKKDATQNNFISDITGISNPSNEIYTIDIEQEIQLRAFIYEEQHSYAEKTNIETKKILYTHKLQRGDITKTIKIPSQSESSQIIWAFMVVDGTYKLDNASRVEHPNIGNKEEFNISEGNLLSSIPKGYVEITDKKGDTLNIKLSDIFDSSLLDPSKEGNIINKNIIFFAYTSDKGIIKAKSDDGVTKSGDDRDNVVAINNAYTQYSIKIVNNWENRIITNDLVSSIELKILQSRFELEFDGNKLTLLENKRTIRECVARSGKKIEHTEMQTITNNGIQETIKAEKKPKDRARVAYNKTHSFYYDTDIQADKSNDNRPLQENNKDETYYVKIPKSYLNMVDNLNALGYHNDRELKSKIAQISWDSFSMSINVNTLDIYTDRELSNKIAKIDYGTMWPFNDNININMNMNININDVMSILTELLKRMKDSKLGFNEDTIIPLRVKYQKRVLINIERYKQTTESTTSTMNLFVDGKRIDKDGKITEEGLDSTTKAEPYAYILERPGPDCITPQLRLRIPSGRYDVVWHNGGKFSEVIKLNNDFIAAHRNVLIHNGNSPKASDGCLLVNKDKVSIGKKEINNILNNSKKVKLKDLIEGEIKKHLFGENSTKKATEIMPYIEIKIINNF